MKGGRFRGKWTIREEVENKREMAMLSGGSEREIDPSIQRAFSTDIVP